MTERLLIILPTRGRPFQALEAIASIMRTASHPDRIDLVVCQDADDPHRFHVSVPGVTVVTERRKRFVQWLNFIVTRWQQDYSHVAWAADDIRYRTEGWDDIIRQHNELVVYGEDGIHNKMMATHPFVRSVIPNTLGFLAPQSLVHICADLFIQNLGIEIGSIAYDDRLKTEHLHHSVGKSKNDQTYEEAAAFVDRDSATFIHEITPVIPELARKVRAKCS